VFDEINGGEITCLMDIKEKAARAVRKNNG
jgi:hypothetical protein